MKDNIGGNINVVHGLKPTLLMVAVQIALAVVNVLFKLAVNDGMSLRVVTAYGSIFATAFIAPLALILERNKRTKMTRMVLFQSFLCGIFGGALSQNLYLESLALISVTFAAAMSNLIPAITFMMAFSFGLEKIKLKTVAGKAKIAGTVTGIGGAMVLTLVKGMEIKIGFFHHINLLHHQHQHQHQQNGAQHQHTGKNVLGVLCALGNTISCALWLIIQKKMTERYQSYYTSTALMSFWATVLSIVFALCIERDSSQWRLGWNIRLLTVAYAGIVISGVVVVVVSWCIQMRGPLFVSIFNPLMLVILAFVCSAILNEKLYIGSIIGAALIVCGLYAVIWGKSKEIMKMNTLVSSSNESDTTVEIVLKSEEKGNNNGVQVIRD